MDEWELESRLCQHINDNQDSVTDLARETIYTAKSILSLLADKNLISGGIESVYADSDQFNELIFEISKLIL